MQQDFASWYTGMSFQSDAEGLQRRWAAVLGAAKSPAKDSLALMARLAFRQKVSLGSKEVAALRDTFAGGGPAPGDDELALLAASVLAVAMNPEAAKLSALPALTVACLSCAGLRPLGRPMDLLGLSENVLRRLADTERRRPSLEQGRLATPATEPVDAATANAVAEGNWSSAFESMFAIANKALEKMATRQRAFEAATQVYVTVQDEELDMLWWLLGGHSFDAGADFAQVPVEQRPLVMSCALASLTKVLPGPPAIEALLTRAGVLEAPQLSIPAAVQAMPAAWLQRIAESVSTSADLPYVNPILFAIVRSHEAGGTDDWIGPWSTVTGISRDAPLEPLKLALAAYREFLFVKLGG